MRVFFTILFSVVFVEVFSQGSDNFSSNIDLVINVLESHDCSWKDESVSHSAVIMLNARAEDFSPRERYLYSNSFVQIATLLLEWDSPEEALLFLNQAKRFDPNNSQAILVKSGFYISEQDYDQAYHCLVKVYPNISSNQYSKAVRLSGKICEVYDRWIKRFYAQGLIDLAFVYATRLDTLLMLYPQGNREYNSLMDSVLIKKQNRYLSHIEALYEKGQYDSALDYIQLITHLMSNYSWYMDSVDLQRQKTRIQRIIKGFVNEGVDKVDIATLINVLDNFSALCEIFSDQTCPLILDSLRTHIYRVNLDILIQRLENTVREKNLSMVLEKIAGIEKFIDKYNIQETQRFYHLRDSLLRLLVTEEIKKIQSYISTHQYSLAKEQLINLQSNNYLKRLLPDTLSRLSYRIERAYILHLLSVDSLDASRITDVERLILKHNMSNDSLIMKELHNCLARISKNCVRVHALFFRVLKQVHTLIMSRNFLQADQKLAEILRKNNELCPLPVDTVVELLNKISPLVTYRLLYNDVSEAYKDHDYERCFDGLMAITHFYRSRQLQKFGLEKPDLYQMIISFNGKCVQTALWRFIEMDSLNIAMKLMRFLHNHGVRARYTKELQQALGYRLALRDFSLHPYESRFKAVRRYMGSDNWWFRFLLGSYFRQRSKMRAFTF